MTPGEQWLALYHPITNRRHQAIKDIRARLKKIASEEGERMLIDALNSVHIWHYHKAKEEFISSRRRITAARKAGENPLLWKLTR